MCKLFFIYYNLCLDKNTYLLTAFSSFVRLEEKKKERTQKLHCEMTNTHSTAKLHQENKSRFYICLILNII